MQLARSGFGGALPLTNAAGAMFRRSSPSVGGGGGGGSPPHPPASAANEMPQWMRTPPGNWIVFFTVVFSTAFCNASSMAFVLLRQYGSSLVGLYLIGSLSCMICVSPCGARCTYSAEGATDALDAGSTTCPMRSNSTGRGAELAGAGGGGDAGMCKVIAFFDTGSRAGGGSGGGVTGGGAAVAVAGARVMKRTWMP